MMDEFELDDLPNNLLPVSQLEAILGAYLSYVIDNGKIEQDYKKKFEFKDIDVMGLSKIKSLV